jgi:hypothetical protein
MFISLAYIIYLLLVLSTVIFVGAYLFRNGKFYLEEIFDDPAIVHAVNRFLYTGYCLVNAGGAARCLYKTTAVSDFQSALIYISENFGTLLIVLAMMHYLNLAILPLLKRSFKKSFKH